jgi:methionyl aminopeptidase
MMEYDSQKIEKMAAAADILHKIFKELINKAKERVSLNEIDQLAEELSEKYEVIPAFKGYEGFPKSVCVGVNDIVVHGIPDDYVLKNGDIVSIDFGIKYKDVFSDCAVTVIIGEVDKEVRKFVETTKKAVLNAIKQAVPGKHIGDISNAMQTTVEKEGYSVVRDMVGHGVGYELHEEPEVPGFGEKGRGEKLYRGQTLAIEAIINMGKPQITISREDGWTSRTKDGMLSALFEHTVVVDKTPRILTKW